MRDPDRSISSQIEVDEAGDTITIFGIRYASAIFETLAQITAPDEAFRVVAVGETSTIEKYSVHACACRPA